MTSDPYPRNRPPRSSPHMRGLRWALPLALLLLLPLPARADEHPGGGDPAAATQVIGIPVGRPAQLDGQVVPAEWSPATALALGDGASQLRLMQFRGTLLVGFESSYTWTRGTTLTLYFAQPDTPGGSNGKGATWIQYEPFSHDRAHLFVHHHGPEGFLRVVDEVVGRFAQTGRSVGLELAIPLPLLGIDPTAPGPLRCCAYWSQANARGACWPAGLDFLSAVPGERRPPALLDTRGWGVLEGWSQVDGPGAYARTEWDAWVAADGELARRGRRAHETVRVLVEEWKGTTKKDSDLQASVLDELAWVGQQESLTSADLVALATVLRFLNRHERALGLWDALVQSHEPGIAPYAHWQRAKTLEAAERFLEAAEDWDHLAARTTGMAQTQNTQRAAWARATYEKWTREQEARAEDRARGTLPLVALHTNRGEIVLELYPDDVPNAVAHFLELVGQKFYDKTCFHRVHGEFMAQGGDPKSRELGCEFAGGGTSGNQIELEENARHGLWRGAVAFANKRHDPRNGSQFFLMTAPAPDLGRYTVFGAVRYGQAVVDRLEWGDVIERVEIVRPAAPGAQGPGEEKPPAKSAFDKPGPVPEPGK